MQASFAPHALDKIGIDNLLAIYILNLVIGSTLLTMVYHGEFIKTMTKIAFSQLHIGIIRA